MTTVWACEKTVVMVKQPGHLTSMKKERGAGTRVYFDLVSRVLLEGDGYIGGRISYFEMAYLELVLLGFSGRRRVQEINGENLCQNASVMRS
jgi:hypothetical protein